MMVSGTYWPPYAPNRPRTTGLERLLGALVITSDCLQERLDQPRIFAAAVGSGGWILNAATDVDAERREGGQRRRDVVRAQTSRHQTAWPDALQGRPIEGRAGAAMEAVGVGVQEIEMSAHSIGRDDLGRASLLANAHMDGLDRRPWHGVDDICGLVARQLDVVEAAHGYCLFDVGGCRINKDPHGGEI